MLSKCELRNVDGATNYSLDSDPVSTGFSSLQKFDPHIDPRSVVDRNKSQAHGVWRTKTFMGGMSIDIEGTLQADTPTHVMAQRALLTRALMGLPTDAITVRKLGAIRIRILGETEDWEADYTLIAKTIPATADSTVIQYLITIFCWNPFFNGVTTPTNQYWW